MSLAIEPTPQRDPSSVSSTPPRQAKGTPPEDPGTPWWAIVSIILIMLAALGLRLGYVMSIDREFLFEQGDEQQYFAVAQNFNSGHGLALDSDQEIQRAPVYPLFLSMIMRINPDFRLIRVFQAVVGALTVGVLFALARQLLGIRSALLAAAIAAIYPFFIYFAGLILSETLFLFLLLLSFYCLVYSWRALSARKRTSQWMGFALMGGLFAALTALTRPDALPVFCLAPVAWLIAGPRRLTGFGVSLLLVSAMFMGMSPWIARNYKRTQFTEDAPRSGRRTNPGHLVVTTLKTGESLYEAVGPFATGGPAKERMAGPFDELQGMNEYEINEWFLHRGWLYIKNNPGRAARLALIKLGRTWNVVPNWEGASDTFHRTVSIVSYVPVVVTAVIGLFVVGIRRPRALAWIVLPVLALSAVHMIFVGSVRYRLMMIPFVIVLSGAGVGFIIEKIFRRRPEPAEETDDR